MKTIVHPWIRFLAALIFLMSGVGNLFAFKTTAARMETIGFSASTFFLVCVIAAEIAAGAYLLFPAKRNGRHQFD